MFRNTNKEVSKEIATKTMSSHKLRNFMAIIAIALTTLLITTVFTTGLNFYEAMNRATDVTPGPKSDGNVVADVSRYEEVTKMDNVKWASYVRPANIGSLHNKEMIGLQSSIFAPDKSFYKNNNVEIIKGDYPKSDNEILISKAMARRLGESGKVGNDYILQSVVLENGERVEKEITAKISGIYTSPIDILSDTYEEIYITEDFISTNMPEMLESNATIYIKFNKVNTDAEKSDLLQEVKEKIDGEGFGFKRENSISGIVLLAVPVVSIIVFCGYLLIYNVFYISVINDIKFFGMLKTIGASKKQLKMIISRQILILSIPGILLGLGLGILLGFKISPFVLNYTDFGKFYKPTVNAYVVFGAVLFSGLTVWISSLKSYRTLSKLSPIEASKYEVKNNRKKKIISILSFGLSSIIFLTLFTSTFGYDIEKMVERYNTSDVIIRQKAMVYYDEEEYQPITEELINNLFNISTVKDVHLFYQARKMGNIKQEGTKNITEPGYAYVKKNPIFEKEHKRIKDEAVTLIEKYKNPYMIMENGDIQFQIKGIPTDQLKVEAINVKILDGSFDEEKFNSGKHVIFNQNTKSTNKLVEGGVRAGDKINLSIYDPSRDIYIDKEVEVMAVIERINPFGTSVIRDSMLTFSDSDFKEIYPNYVDLVERVKVDTKSELTKMEYEEIEETIKESFNSQLEIGSKYATRQSEIKQKEQMTILGLLVAGVFGVIGLANVVNTEVTSIMARKLEFATMQSIGMTKKQMTLSILKDGIFLCAVSFVVAVPSSYFIINLLSYKILLLTGFDLKTFIIGCIILFIIMIIVTLLTATLLTWFLNKKTITERIADSRE
ncbi:ABC transporter permease [Miniphocaeibacter massiliensis]|uniref:ABC transporter permease n=1 Tax=Miniphocaeibacter massiliensis TaxID=2041841 RepID=UPI000C07EF8C|nr:FtsX-like permease family protein [Miniphocaeibacter massiliensis]